MLFCHKSSNPSLLNDSDEDDVDPRDSISQTTTNASGTSNTSSVLKRIELELKKAELQSLEQLNKLKARKAQFEAEARKAQLEAEEASIKLRLETANLEAEEKMLACSERGSKIGSVSKSFTRSRWPGESSSKVQKNRGKLEPKIKIAKPAINLTDTVQQNPFVTAKVASYKEQMLKDFENPSLNWQNESVETKPHFTCNMNFDSCTDARPRDRDTLMTKLKCVLINDVLAHLQIMKRLCMNTFRDKDAMSTLILRLKSVMMARISRLSSMKTRFAGS